MIGYIYIAVSPVGKKYYGQTIKRMAVRKNRHLQDAKRGCNFRFHQALRKYNYKFNWRIHEEIFADTKEELINILNERETYWILKDKTNLFEFGYNCSHGGDNKIPIRKPHSEISKQKIRQALLGVKHTEERKLNESLSHKGQTAWNKGLKKHKAA